MVDQIQYSYTNTQWGDLLTSYNGSTITYDAMGDPTSYRGFALTWEGKQLTECERPFVGTVAEYFYSYDENGLRTQKRMEASLAGNAHMSTLS